MNKQEIIAEITANHTIFGGLTDIGLQYPGAQGYIASVLDVSGNRSDLKKIGFIVIDEGGPGETAYYTGGTPRPANFADEAQAFITANIGGAILAGFLESVDVANEKATVWAVRDNAGSIEEVKGLLYKDGNGDVQIQVIDVPLRT